MKWLKKWSYLILLMGMGIIYMTRVDGWQVYAEPLWEAKSWYDRQKGKDVLPADGSVLGNAETGQDVGEPEGTVSPDSGSGNSVAKDAESGPESGLAAEGEDGIQGTVSGSGNEAPPPDGETGESGSAQPPDGGQSQEPGEEGQNPPEGIPPKDGEGNPPEGGAGDNPPGEVAYMTVEDDYFADAVFIGDSRTMGLFEYGGLEDTAAFYASTGLTVYKMFEAEIVPGENGKITVEEALQQNSFAKIYLMIGINEMGTGTVESFLEAYEAAVAHLRELQPDAIIYLQAIIKVTTERSEQGDYINNEGIIARNEGIARLADNEHVFFLDVNPLICDETGGMIPEYTFDGVHLKAVYIDIWKDFLKTHAVSLP